MRFLVTCASREFQSLSVQFPWALVWISGYEPLRTGDRHPNSNNSKKTPQHFSFEELLKSFGLSTGVLYLLR